MGDRLREFAWFFIMSTVVLVTGTVAIAIPVSRFSMCYEIKASDPPVCYLGARPDNWLQTYQALVLAMALWLLASIALPVLIMHVTSYKKYGSLQVLWLFVACISGSGVGTWWAERRYPDSYWENNDSAMPTVLGIFWTGVISWSIIDAQNKKFDHKDAQVRTPPA